MLGGWLRAVEGVGGWLRAVEGVGVCLEGGWERLRVLECVGRVVGSG